MKEERKGGKESQERGSLAGGEEGVDSLSHTQSSPFSISSLLLQMMREERRGEERVLGGLDQG